VERNEGSEEEYEVHFQGFLGQDTRSNIVRHTGYRYDTTLNDKTARHRQMLHDVL